jgi:6-pyruvoyl-tetrahydropterin synthase
MLIQVRHNIEVAHRLYEALEPGNKCENIHGHSMWVELSLMATEMRKGILVNAKGAALEFGNIKYHFRQHLDNMYDHHLLLNKDDPWAGNLFIKTDSYTDKQTLPGMIAVNGDPSTENLAYWIARWASKMFECDVNVLVRETSVNAASMGVTYAPS